MILIYLMSFLQLFGQPVKSTDSKTANYSFKNGEVLEFKLGYGWFTLGKATVDIDDQFIRYANEECYKVEIVGQTAGLLGVFAHVNDTWGSYVEKKGLKPLYSYQNIEEGKYRRDERAYFNYDQGELKVIRYDKNKPPKLYEITESVNDILSAYLKVRNVNFSGMRKGDTLTVYTYYDKVFYNLHIVYEGQETIKTRVGKLNAHRLTFFVPASDVFPEEGGISAWVSADANQLPLRVEAEMFFGKGYCELVAYQNVKHGPDFREE